MNGNLEYKMCCTFFFQIHEVDVHDGEGERYSEEGFIRLLTGSPLQLNTDKGHAC